MNTSHTQNDGPSPDISEPENANREPTTGNQVDVQVRTMSTDGVKRYAGEVKLSRTDVIESIPANKTTFTRELPEHLTKSGWTRSVHPEGAVYFRHVDQGIYTDNDIRDLRNFNAMISAIKIIDESARKADPPIHRCANVHLVIELQPRDAESAEGNAKRICSYYFVNHAQRCLFWSTELKDDVSSELFFHVKGIESWDHVRHAMETQYWSHCELFPDSLCLLPRKDLPVSQAAGLLVDELKQTIFHASADAFTTKKSLIPFDAEELGKLLELTNHMGDYFKTSEVSPYVKVVVAKVMGTIAHARFFNFHGEVGARLNVNETVYNVSKRPASVLFHITSWLLFRAPNFHMETLRTIWVDQTINYVPWTKFLENLNSEWQELVLYATVILNANVAFLAIPGVSASSAQTGSRICSYLSVATSVGAVAIGLILMRQNRTKHRETAEDAATFMMRMDCSTFGMETIAMLFSMPYGMLMWSVIFFVSAFCIVMFSSMDWKTGVPVGFVAFLVLIFTIWTVSYTYADDDPELASGPKEGHNHSGVHPGGSAAQSSSSSHLPPLSVQHVQSVGPKEITSPSPSFTVIPQLEIAVPAPT